MTADFAELTPEVVLESVEHVLGQRCTGLIRSLPSYINRVYALELESGEYIVAKFYRPRRWSKAAILEEHAYVLACAQAEIPVIAPLVMPDKSTLGEAHGIFFALFPRRGGRPIEPADPGNAMWSRLGALLARIHNIGAQAAAPARLSLHPALTTTSDLDYILENNFLEQREAKRLERLGYVFLEETLPLFEGVEMIRIHGDCQHTNVLERPETGIFLIDFDDMMMGPPVHDLWMLLPERLAEARTEMQQLLEGYAAFRAFDRATLALIEPLRMMRMIYYLAWCARQSQDAAFHQAYPGWGTRNFWEKELLELEHQLEAVRQG